MGLLDYDLELAKKAIRKFPGLLNDYAGKVTSNIRDQFGMNNADASYAMRNLDGMAGGDLRKAKADNIAQMAQKMVDVGLNFNPAAVGMFIGKGAKTWDAVKAAEAEKRIAAGEDVRKVWKETGTFKGPDGHLRQEIPDNKSFYRGSSAAGSSYAEDVFLHPDLYGNYSGFGTSRVIESKIPGGSYNEKLGRITVGPTDSSSTMLHELQHAIQGREGWARGGSAESFKESNSSIFPEMEGRLKSVLDIDRLAKEFGKSPSEVIKSGAIDPSYADAIGGMDLSPKNWDSIVRYSKERLLTPDEAYRRLAGEAEARATQARMNMNMEQRLNNYPLDSYDVPIDQLIIRGGLLK
jgi:hypothetical protein